MRSFLVVLALLAVVAAFGQVFDIDGHERPVSPAWKMPTATVLQSGYLLATSTTITEYTVATFPSLLTGKVPFFMLEVIPASGQLQVGPPNTATAAMASLSYVTNAAPFRAWVATTTPLFGFTASPGTSLLVFVNILK